MGSLIDAEESWIKQVIKGDKFRIRKKGFIQCPKERNKLAEIGYERKSNIIDISYAVCDKDFSLYSIQYEFNPRERWKAKTNSLEGIWISNLEDNLVKEPLIIGEQKFTLYTIRKLLDEDSLEEKYPKKIIKLLRKRGIKERTLNNFIMRYFVR